MLTIDEIKEALAKKDALYSLCEKFIEDNGITCSETIYQTDWVIQNAYSLIQDICDTIGYSKAEE